MNPTRRICRRSARTSRFSPGRLGPLALALAFAAGGPALAEADASTGQVALHQLRQEVAFAGLLGELAGGAPQGRVVIRNVHLVDPDAADGTASPASQSVILGERRILWVGDTGKEPKVPDLAVVDGAGGWLVPGLTDMHVHSSSAAGWLLDLAYGVTAVRDMAGFPWMLEARDAIDAGRMLGPTLAVAGPLFNAFPLDDYAEVPASSLAARRLVRQQAACGYDFVKVHNVVPQPVFDAIAQQARTLGIDLVGHVPHQITVRHAVTAGMRTMEHLKGYLDDGTLELGETDYAAAADGPEVWNTPTLYAARGNAWGDDARRLLTAPEMRYVPLRKLERWRGALDQPVDDNQKKGWAAGALMQEIVGKLHAVHARFLAGTDSDGYAYEVPGAALVAELGLLEQAGLSPLEALRAATSETARAMRLEGEVGHIQRGQRADLVLLGADPAAGTKVFVRNRGVVAHGVWLERARLDGALERLAAIQAESDAAERYDETAGAAVVASAEAAARGGFVFDSHLLTEAADELRVSGWSAVAARLDALADLPKDGPCAEARPN
jgi:imidazolonepropionase-like amidohydrolase